ncbi:hypothetical protein [Rhizobium halophilum]|uniref:hypothetical protein n=1 Tax=Rhizobium halophilum TaxID=2846852 RepID=UPI001EFE52D5|nr:hypothetical protein [Rhizobium halophilum]MCF6371349.1 hypothetical protein [Rhizobium halophilum]
MKTVALALIATSLSIGAANADPVFSGENPHSLVASIKIGSVNQAFRARKVGDVKPIPIAIEGPLVMKISDF